MPRTLLSLGSVNADFQARIDRRPEVSETLLARAFSRFSGGKAANRAVLARRLDRAARLIGRVGADDLAEQALAPLREAGVDLAAVLRAEGAATAVSMITVPPDGRKGVVLAPGANDGWREAEAAAAGRAVAAAAPGDVLACDAEADPAALEAALAAAREAGLTVLLDPSPAGRVSDALLARVDALAPNAGEASALSGVRVEDAASAARAAAALAERGPERVCVRLAGGGLVARERGRAFAHAPVEVEVVDTTGAGDAFAGALGVGLLDGLEFQEAAALASAATHLAVGAWGSQPAYPDRAALEGMRARLPDPDAL